MNIVCATLNSKYIHSTLAPWCLKAGVDAFCSEKHNVSVIESTVNADLNDFTDEIISKKPNVIAFSCYIWNIKSIINIAEILKMKTGAVVVLGGPEAEFNYTSILNNYAFVDYILCGEGEWSFSAFIDNLCSATDLHSCHGICFRDNNDIVFKVPLFQTDTPPSPYCDEYFSQLNKRIVYIEGSRGCPYRCSYCLSGTIGKMRCFNIEQIKNDLVRLSQSGTQTIKFVDRTFNADVFYCNEILSFINAEYGKAIPEGVCFHFEMSGDIIKPSTVELLKLMPEGLCQLEIGIQSFNKNTLTAINRASDLDRLIKNVETLLEEQNIHIHTDLIAGLPFENLESFKESFNKAYYVKSNMLQLGFLKLLHGADINSDKVKYGYSFNTEPPYEIISNNWLSAEDLIKIKNCEKALDKLYNNGRFLITLEYILNVTAFSPFDLFSSFGVFIKNVGSSLTEIIECLYLHFSEYCDSNRLKECILCDLASIDANIHIPDKIKVFSPEYKRLKKKYSEYFQENVRIVECRAIHKVFVVRSSSRKNLMNRYTGEYFELN